MKQEKLIIYYHLFVPWIHDGYSRADLLDAWSSGESPEDHAISIAASFPVQHFKNWDEVKHHWDNGWDDNPYDGSKDTEDLKFKTWSDWYEHDGYVEGIPDTLEVEWDYDDKHFTPISVR